jgi:tetratricopeptide (TPR) repeat protein
MRRIFFCIVIAAATAVAFLPALDNDFTNWDDNVYVTNNPSIQGFSIPHIARQFSSSIGYYHPLTMLTFMTDYRFFGLNPRGYHLTGVLFHGINALLVFALIFGLSGNDLVAFIAALFFAVHPLRVESVAWIAERKDVVSSFFYLASLLSYLGFRRRRERKYFFACMLLFLCSLLSKPMAVTLPVVLLLIDYLVNGTITVRLIVEKGVFFAIAVSFSILTYFTQMHYGAVTENIPILQRLFIPAFGILFYLCKTIAPLHLSAYYTSGCIYFPRIAAVIYPVLAIGLAAAAFRIARYSRTAIFCLLFFIVTLLPVLQIIQIGGFIVADRYTYIPTIGLCYFAAWAIVRFIENPRAGRPGKYAMVTMVGFGVIVFTVLTRERCTVWKNSETLWNDVIGKYPSSMAYDNRGHVYYLRQDYAGALADYNRGLLYDSTDAFLYYNRGLLFDDKGDHERAIGDYGRAIAHKPGFAEAYNNRGYDYYVQGNDERAIADFERTISLNPEAAKAYNNLGNVLARKGEYRDAIADYDRAVALNPDFADAWYDRGRCHQAVNELDQAVACFTRTLEIDTAYAQASNDRGVTWGMRGDLDRAMADFNRAIVLQPSSPDAYVNRGNAYSFKKDFPRAIIDFSLAIRLDSAKYPQVYYFRGVAYRSIGEIDHAEEDFRRACAMHIDAACRELSWRGSHRDANL